MMMLFPGIENFSQLALVCALLVPLLGALLLSAFTLPALKPFTRLRDAIVLSLCLMLITAVLAVLAYFINGTTAELVLFSLFPGLAIELAAEPLGLAFAATASLLWLFTSLFSLGYMRESQDQHQTRFYVFFSLALASTMGLAFSANLVSFFIFYELLTLCTYPLVTHSGTDEARKAGRIYLALLLGPSFFFLFAAILWTWSATGRLDFTLGGFVEGTMPASLSGLLLLLYVFGISKIALMPLHRWLPAAMVAPAPVSALLHAVAVVKGGIFAVMKIALYVFGLDYLVTLASRPFLLYLAAFTVIAASLIALAKTDLKARLAYSTIAQLACAIIGVMLASPLGFRAAVLQLVMHAFAKITLFLCAGHIALRTGRDNVRDMKGLGRHMPWTFAAFFLASLSLIGFPPLGGMWSKVELLRASLAGGELWLAGVILASSFLTAAYLLPVFAAACFGPSYEAVQRGRKKPEEVSEHWLCAFALSATALGSFLLFFFADAISAFIDPLFTGGLE